MVHQPLLQNIFRALACLLTATGFGAILWLAVFIFLRAVIGIPLDQMLLPVAMTTAVIVFYFIPQATSDMVKALPPVRPQRFTRKERRERRRLVRAIKRHRRQRRAHGSLAYLTRRLEDAQTAAAFAIPGLSATLTAVTHSDIQTLLANPTLTRHYLRALDRCHPAARRTLTLDATQLSPAARMLFLSVLIEANDGRRYDRLTGCDTSTGVLTYQSAARAIDAERWRKALPTISKLLSRSYHVRDRDGLTIDLVPLAYMPASIPLDLNACAPRQLLLGYDLVTGEPVWLAFADLTHTLVAGPTGMGKSTFAHSLIRQLLHHPGACARLILIDLKDGLEFSAFRTKGEDVVVIDEFAALADALAQVEACMAERIAALKERGLTTWHGPPVIIIVDEFARIALHPDGEAKAVLAAFIRIGNQARAAGIYLFIQVQHAVAETLPTALRRNLLTTVAFRQPSGQAAAALLGDAQDLPADITRLGRGQFIYRSGRTAETFALQAPVIKQALPQRGAP